MVGDELDEEAINCLPPNPGAKRSPQQQGVEGSVLFQDPELSCVSQSLRHSVLTSELLIHVAGVG